MEIAELNKMRNRYYLLEDDAGGIYCSKCGKKVLKDTYQYTKHESFCKVKFVDKYQISKNEQIYGYSFRIIDDFLVFTVYSLALTPVVSPVNKYSGSKWKVIFTAKFKKDSKEVYEKGLYNVDIWFKKMIDMDGIECLNKYDYMKVINKFYSSVHEIYNFGMFLDLYRQKGYKQSNLTAGDVKDIDDVVFSDFSFIEETYKKFHTRLLNSRVCICEPIKIKDEVVLRCLLYDFDGLLKYKEGDNKEVLNPINTIFISKDFIYGKKDFTYEELFYILNFKYNDIEVFTNKYPELMIDTYLKNNGSNIFKIILSSNYNKCIELTAKAGFTKLSDGFEFFKDKVNLHGNNIKEIFGMPVKVVKSLNSYAGIQYLMENDKEPLIHAFELHPNIFDDVLNASQLRFIHETYHKKNPRNIAFKDITDKMLIQGVRYLGGKEFLSDDGRAVIAVKYDYYKDYLNMCRMLEDYIFGYFPNNLLAAHDSVSILVQINADKILRENFKRAVESYNYKSLASSHIKDGSTKPDIESKVYEIIVPTEHTDLVRESEELHHCVRTYIESVANGSTYILFLRKKTDLNKPFATIEVLPNKTLIQLKASCNTHVDAKAQDFVEKWAKAKKLTIKSRDFD